MKAPGQSEGRASHGDPADTTTKQLTSLTKTDSHSHHIATAAGRGDQPAVT